MPATRTDDLFPDAQFKDNTPENTVTRIRQILANHGIEPVESWFETCVPYCHALSVYVKGTTFSVNGKGLTKEFARASAYGELMERLQMGYIYTPGIQKDGVSSYIQSTRIKMPATQLLEEYGNWYRLLSRRLERFTGITKAPADLLGQYADAQGNLDVIPYFCLTKNKPVYYPHELRGRAYGSNGCAAGNTPEEALVQAISEIVERHHMIQIIDGGITLPDVPEEVLQSCPTAYKIITFIREHGYRVIVKDCSLGKKYPVVCLYIIDQRTGRYHTHLGAYPIFEIALERALTESFQGRDIHHITYMEDFIFKNPGEFLFASVSDEIIRGSHEKTTSFFVGRPSYAFNEQMGFQGKDNRSLLDECIAFFKEQGYDILVRDRSCLGFCTYQVIIPGYSEAFLHRLHRPLDEYRYSASAIKVLRNPSAASLPELLGYLMHEDQMKQYPSTIHGVHGFLAHSKISALAPKSVDHFLLAATKGYIYHCLGKSQEAISCINGMLPIATAEETDFLLCLKRYYSLVVHRYQKEEINQILAYLHKDTTVESLWSILQRKENPFTRFTLHCDTANCTGCRLEPYCCQKRVLEVAGILNAQDSNLNFEAFSSQMRQLVQK